MSIIKKLKPFIYQLITSLIIIVTTLIIISIIIINYMQDVPDFKKYCELNDGIYFEIAKIANITCEVGYLNCWRVCETEDRQFTLDDYYSSWKILG